MNVKTIGGQEKMAKYISYQHIEKLNSLSPEIEGLLNGEVILQSKIDGTNGCIYLGDDGEVHGGSRKRELSATQDNQGFFNTVCQQEKYKLFFNDHPNLMLYGEYGIRNCIKNYTEYGDFHVFDIVDTETGKYIHWNEFKKLLTPYGIKFIPVITTLLSPTVEEVALYADKGRYLCGENTIPEGIVVKRIDFVNQFGRTTWGKIVLNEYKIAKKTGKTIDERSVEVQIIEKHCTEEFIKKEYFKLIEQLKNEDREWNKKHIGRLLSTIWYVFVTENMWTCIKEFKNPTIDFKVLYGLVTEKIKNILPELFTREG